MLHSTQFSIVAISGILHRQYTGYVSIDTIESGARRYLEMEKVVFVAFESKKTSAASFYVDCTGSFQVSGQEQELLHWL